MKAPVASPRDSAQVSLVKALGFVSVLGLAAWVRLNIHPKVLFDRVAPSDGDSEYHFRRMLLAYESWPRIDAFDPLLGWPRGAAHHWSLGFDWVAALWMRALAPGGADEVATAAALFPVVVGLLFVWCTVDVTQRLVTNPHFSAAPYLAGAIAALVPQGVSISRLAKTDHHGAEALGVMVLLGWCLRRFDARTKPWAFEVFGLLGVLVATQGFIGGTLYVALATAVLLGAALFTGDAPRLWGSGAPALLGASALSFLLVVPQIAVHGQALSFKYPSYLQPALVAAAGFAMCLALAFRRARMLVAALAACAVAALMLSGLGPEIRSGIAQWLFKNDPWLSRISEFQPLFSMRPSPVDSVLFHLGVAGLFCVPLGALAAWKAQRDRPGPFLTFAFFFTALLALTVLQMRFGRVFAPLLAVACALGFDALGRVLGKTNKKTASVALGLGFLMSASDPEVRREMTTPAARAPSPIEEAARTLSMGLRSAAPGQRDGVLAPWELGNSLVSLASRPVIACGFGSFVDPEGFALSEAAFAGDEQGLLRVMQARDLGFVVTGAGSELDLRIEGKTLLRRTSSGQGMLDLDFVKTRPLAMLALGGTGIPEQGVPHVEHLMPLSASTARVSGLEWVLPVLWTYARVEGAVVRGITTPGTRVDAQLAGTFRDGQSVTWRAWARSGLDGTFSLRLAVPSGWKSGGLSTDTHWVFTAEGGETRPLAVTESAVREGGAFDVAFH